MDYYILIIDKNLQENVFNLLNRNFKLYNSFAGQNYYIIMN